jgi:hypothetical protein
MTQRIQLVGHTHCKGKVLRAGPVQSEVKWDNGNEVVVVNTWIEPADEPDAGTSAAAEVPAGARGHGGAAVDRVPAPALVVPARTEDVPKVKAKRTAPADDLVDELKRFGLPELKHFAVNNGVWDDKYASLPNPGLVRMNVINRLRAKVRKTGHKVVWK